MTLLKSILKISLIPLGLLLFIAFIAFSSPWIGEAINAMNAWSQVKAFKFFNPSGEIQERTYKFSCDKAGNSCHYEPVTKFIE
jgi:hypothetical protein